MRRLALPLLLLIAAAPRAEAADPVTVYRCTDSAGHVSLRDTPCPKGQRQQSMDMQRPVDPKPRPVVVPPAPAEPTVVGHTRVVFVDGPRDLYQCTTPDGDRYTSETGDGNPRWVPLWTVGVPAYWPRNPLGDRVGAPHPHPPGDGPGPPDYPPIVGIAYTPGTWIRDNCVRLPEAQACEVLRAEQRALRKEWFNAMPTRRAEVAEEERVLEGRVARTCGGGP